MVDFVGFYWGVNSVVHVRVLNNKEKALAWRLGTENHFQCFWTPNRRLVLVRFKVINISLVSCCGSGKQAHAFFLKQNDSLKQLLYFDYKLFDLLHYFLCAERQQTKGGVNKRKKESSNEKLVTFDIRGFGEE